LFWFVAPHISVFPKARDEGNLAAPSWSWALVNGSWGYARLPLDARVVASYVGGEIHLASPDPFGAIEVGRINVQAPFISAVIGYSLPDAAEEYPTRLRKQAVQLIKGDQVPNTDVDFVLDSLPDHPLMSGDTVYCLHI
jgi:hypothetical protein